MVMAFNKKTSREKKILNYLLYTVGISNFISIAATQILYGILIIFLLKKLFKKEISLKEFPHIYIIIALSIFIDFSFIVNAANVKHFIKKLFHWWLYFPFFIGYFLPENEKTVKNIFKALLLGGSVAAIAGIYEVVFASERGSGFYSHALTSGNNWALILVIGYSILITKSWENKKDFIFYLVTTILIALGLISSEAKGPILYFSFVFIFINYVFLKKKGIIVSLFAIILLIGIIFSSSSLQKRFADIYKGINNPYTSTGNRVILWKNTLKIIKNKPIFGIGSNFKKEIQKVVKIKLKWKSHPHNGFLTIAVNHGVPALIIFIILFIAIYKKLFSSENTYSYIGLGFVTLYLLEGLTENNFGDSEVKMLFWFVLGLIYAILFRKSGQEN